MQIKAKITPRAKKNQIIGWQNDILRVHITAPPVDGKANKALIDFLAEEWGVAQSTIRIIRGETSREKVLEVPDGVVKKQSGLL